MTYRQINEFDAEKFTAAVPTSYVSVPDFYAGKSIFITGGTGFLGKVFLEKLLYSCKDVETVYILIREKKGKTPQQRVEDLFNKPVSVVFHVAANVQFYKEFKEIINTNVGGTKYVLQLCQRIKDIKAFVHISTAYCHTDQKVLEERIYPPPAELSEVLKFLQQPQHDKKQIKELFISASLKEPLPGWVDSWNGATGLITASYNGANRVLLGEGSNFLDLIPVDFVANLAIVAAAKCTR
ncbi:hypothetical protein HF086_015411 [Spodoptera exigua]|uniref:Fatty acyl-CoA reductase n=1 Tax=Spodoptera exigua TaxID=7107 RepID=A0A922MWH1_SPOEX|nr:hypothetical protein HF086_015411 [Spodoptera exigua]